MICKIWITEDCDRIVLTLVIVSESLMQDDERITLPLTMICKIWITEECDRIAWTLVIVNKIRSREEGDETKLPPVLATCSNSKQ